MQTAGGNPVRVLGDSVVNNAAVGEVGEYIRITRLTGAAVALVTATPSAVAVITGLTAGDWDVSGVIDWVFAATTSYTQLQAGITIGGPTGGFGGGLPAQAGLTSTNGTVLEPDSVISIATPAEVPTAIPFSTPVGPVRITVPSGAAPVNVGLIAQAVFTVAALSAAGTIRARRVQ